MLEKGKNAFVNYGTTKCVKWFQWCNILSFFPWMSWFQILVYWIVVGPGDARIIYQCEFEDVNQTPDYLRELGKKSYRHLYSWNDLPVF